MRRAFFTAIVALVVLAGVLPATAVLVGDTPEVRYYEGPTSEGGRLRIRVVVSDDGVAWLSLLLMDGPYRCTDGTEGEAEAGVGWLKRGSPVIADQHLEVSENWGVIAFMGAGRIGAHGGSGTLTFLLPALTANEQAQVCTMGEITWTVERTDGEDFPFKSAVLVQRSDGRTITMTALGATRSDATIVPAKSGLRPIRHYHGRTSQGLPMVARTRWTDMGVALHGLTWEYVLACDDGSENGGGDRPLAFLEATMVMPPGRLDMDVGGPAPDVWVLAAEAFHFHGELDAHSGSGTLAIIWSMITDDLQAQLCKSGELTWELWRTDAGY
jgi:hypothetical protein